MSRKDYYEVGAIMTRKSGKNYEVVESLVGCIDCAFDGKKINFCSGIKCYPVGRKDENRIIFIRRKDLEE